MGNSLENKTIQFDSNQCQIWFDFPITLCLTRRHCSSIWSFQSSNTV